MISSLMFRKAVCTLAALIVAGGLWQPATLAAQPTGLPNHFGIGLIAGNDSNGLNGWLPDSKIPWDYAYQYLSGGVNHGWATWNDKGQFATYYTKAASSHGYIPVFSYYNLLYSDGPCGGCNEGDKNMAHLNDPTTMKAYFDDFALLMKRLGGGNYDGIQGFGQTAIVHVEPDLSGFAEHAAKLDDPTTVPAAVASSGMPDVAAFPNTYQGFNWALLHLRDQYAPNVVLAFHLSPWATNVDIGSSSDPSIDAAAVGGRTGAFAAASGVTQAGPGTSTYDLVFTDVLDRDAGFYEYAQNDPHRWWDRLNLSYPNFQRWEQWLASANQAAGRKPIVVWQIPIGNQYFQTENNSKGHYQDNRAEYFFNHLDELRQIGIIALLFGGGGGDVTGYNDGLKDGITNAASFCTSDGVSTGQVCNDHPSTVADDDGGYLRMMATQYFANPLPLLADTGGSAGGQAGSSASTSSSGTLSTPPASIPLEVDLGGTTIDPPVASPGQDVTLRQDTISSTNSTVMVSFLVVNARGQQIYQAQVPDQQVLVGLIMSSSTVFTLPDDLPTGRYGLKVGVYTNDGTQQLASSEYAGTLTVR